MAILFFPSSDNCCCEHCITLAYLENGSHCTLACKIPVAKMKLIVKSKDISCLKVLLSAEFAKVPVDIQVDSKADKPILIVSEDVQYFSLNTAAWYVSSLKVSRKFSAEISSWLEWEATVLSPALESKQVKTSLAFFESNLTKSFITGVSLYSKFNHYST